MRKKISRNRWKLIAGGVAVLLIGGIATTVLASLRAVEQPEGVGTLESPAAFGEEFQLAGDSDGAVRRGTVLGVVEFPPDSSDIAARCYLVEGIVQLDADDKHPHASSSQVDVSLKTDAGAYYDQSLAILGGRFPCVDPPVRDILAAQAPFGIGPEMGDQAGRWQLFYTIIGVPESETVDAIVVTTGTSPRHLLELGESSSVYEFTVGRTIDRGE